MNEFQSCAEALIAAGQQLYIQGMVPATSGNFSARLANDHLAITVSGRHKGKLSEQDIMEVDVNGVSLDERRSMQTTWLVRDGEIDARVSHPHVKDFNAIEI